MEIRPLLHLVLTVALAFLIYSGYRQLNTDIRLLYEGKTVQATVTEIETQPKYFYVKIEYRVLENKYTRSFRLKESRPWKVGQKIDIRVLNSDPQVMSLDYNPRKLDSAIYYVLVAFMVLVIGRSIWLMAKSTRPNYE